MSGETAITKKIDGKNSLVRGGLLSCHQVHFDTMCDLTDCCCNDSCCILSCANGTSKRQNAWACLMVLCVILVVGLLYGGVRLYVHHQECKETATPTLAPLTNTTTIALTSNEVEWTHTFKRLFDCDYVDLLLLLVVVLFVFGPLLIYICCVRPCVRRCKRKAADAAPAPAAEKAAPAAPADAAAPAAKAAPAAAIPPKQEEMCYAV